MTLLPELALQLEREEMTPNNRSGTVVLLGQYLLHILRRKLRTLGGATATKPQTEKAACASSAGLDPSQLPVSYGELGRLILPPVL